MPMKLLFLRVAFILVATLFSMFLGGFLGGRVFSPHSRNIDGMFDALGGVGWGLIIGGTAALIAAVKMPPEYLAKANIAALICLVAEVALLSQFRTAPE